MSFRNKLQYFLVKKLSVSNREVQQLLFNGKVSVNGAVTSSNPVICADDTVVCDGKILQEKTIFRYIAFYKPHGIETTLNNEIEANLNEILPFDDVFPVGRLDKESEGLLLLTNDGRLYDKILRKEFAIEKEYLVYLDKPITNEFLEKMANGIQILGKTTLPCWVEAVGEKSFKIILIQGINRQIRRMCYKLGYEVTSLIRLRIGNATLDGLLPQEWRFLNKNKIL
jgi:23S rRNA pseudouridine2604 synthase